MNTYIFCFILSFCPCKLHSIFLFVVTIMAIVIIIIIIIIFQGLGLLACSSSEFIFWNLGIYCTVGRTPWTGHRPDARPLPTHRKTRTHIHASSGIRTHDPSVLAVEDSTCLNRSAIGTGAIHCLLILLFFFFNYYFSSTSSSSSSSSISKYIRFCFKIFRV
jgi:energy-coupling factor transporter transmembrane protein EcfT